MMKWPRFRDLFSFEPPLKAWRDPSHVMTEDELNKMMEEDRSDERDLAIETFAEPCQLIWERIRFDNTLRLWICCLSYMGCCALWLGHMIQTLRPVTEIFAAYGSLQYLSLAFFINSRHARRVDFLLCAIDLMGISLI